MSPALAVGQMIPFLTLPTASGGTLRLSAYRGRVNLALYLFPHGDDVPTSDCLAAVAAHLPTYRERHTQPLAILGGDHAAARRLQAVLDLPYPLAADPDGRAVRALAPQDAAGRQQPLVALTDRYAELRVHLSGWEAIRPDQQPDILEWLTYIDCLCSC